MTSEDTAPKADNGSTLEANLVDPGLETEGNRKSPAKSKTPCCSGLKAFLAALAFTYFSKVFSGAIMKSSFTQLERRFGISSSTAGFMDAGFEIGNLMTIAFVSYFGAKFHRPRVIALGCFIMSLGSFLAALPHFFMGPYNYDTLSKVSSNSTSRISPCSASQTTLEVTEMLGPGCEREVASNAWIYVLMGNLLRGIGETPVTPLGISYLDDFSREEDAPFYIGCLHTIGMIGPIAGFLLGSQLAKLYVDIGFVDLGTVTITPTDSRWVGAWWMGFLLAGVFNLISGIPFCFLPKSLHREDKNSSVKEETDNEKSRNDANCDQKAEVQLEENCTEKMKGFFVSLKKVLGNRMYFVLLCVSMLQFNSFIGYITYNRKYIEQQYGLPASKSNFIMGVMVLPVTCLGIFLGGFIMKKYKIDIIAATKMAFTTSFVGFLISLLYLTVGCENNTVAGLTVTYDGQPISHHATSLTSACNANCSCAADQWDPVCGNNGITYISACFAGCKTITGSRRETVLHNCSCITETESSMKNSSAVLGECQKSDECSRNLIYFIAIKAVSLFFYALGGTPFYMITIRCVHKEVKALAVGLYMLILRTLAGIPSPVYFGAVIDMACMKWARKSCGQRGACMFYDSKRFRYSLFGLMFGIRLPSYLLGIVFFLLVKKRFGRKAADETENKKEEAPLNEEVKPSAPEWSADLSHEETDTHV